LASRPQHNGLAINYMDNCLPQLRYRILWYHKGTMSIGMDKFILGDNHTHDVDRRSNFNDVDKAMARTN